MVRLLGVSRLWLGAWVVGVLVGSFAGIAPRASAAIVAEDIAHHWAFEEGAGTVTDDRFSYLGDGSLLDGGGGQGGTAAFSTDAKIGSYAMDFTGGLVNVSGISGFHTEDFTFSAWVKARSVGGGGYGYMAYDRGGVGFPTGWACHVNGNLPDLDANPNTIGVTSYVTGGPGISSPSDVYTMGEYAHVTMSVSPVVDDQVTMSLYLNGTLVASDTGSPVSQGSAFFGLGNTTEYATVNDRWFDGLIDEVAIFNRELTAAEVEDFYTNLNGSVSNFEVPVRVDPWDGAPPNASDTSLRLWLKAGVGTNNALGNPAVVGEAVAQWQDQSSYANHASAGGDATLASDTIDGQEVQVVNFNGDDYFETFLGQIAEPRWSMFLVLQQDAEGNQKWIGYDEAADDSKVSWIGTGNAGNNSTVDVGINAAYKSNIVTTGTEYELYNVVYDTVDGISTARLYLDGVLVEHFTSVNYPDLGSIVFDNLKMHVGKRAWDNSGHLIGDIGELLFYDQSLTDQQLNDIGAYLADEFNLATDYVTGESPSLEGDLNSDGFVGGDDLDIVRSFWGQNVTSGELLEGDPSGDGFVGGDDLDIVRANWGQGSPPAPSAVPEPATLVGLLTLVAAGLVCRRQRED